MKTQYHHLRPERAVNFDLDVFKNKLQNITDFNDQLNLWNEHFDLPAMGRRLSIDTDHKIVFHFYCESPECRKNFTPENQEIIINWRRKHYLPLKITFDKITVYQERVNFCFKHFGTALSTFVPEEDIIFCTMPESPDEWKLYNQITYERWKNQWLCNPILNDKSFEKRQQLFLERIINHIHPFKGLQDEIDCVYNEYFQPDVMLDKILERENVHIKIFRDRYNGHLRNYSEDNTNYRGIPELMKSIEGEEAYKYYKYLIELQRKPRWIDEFKLMPLTTNMKVSAEPLFDSERLTTDKLYQFNMIDEFTEHMDTIYPYADRVSYYMKISRAMGIGIMPLNIGAINIFERDYWSTNNGRPLIFFDKDGITVPYKQWGLTATTDEERKISRKQWFIEQRHVEFKTFNEWINEPLEKRKEQFYTQLDNYNLADLSRLHLNIINDEITRFHSEYNESYDRDKSGTEMEAVKRQRLNAPMLVESELLGKQSINWLAFHRGYLLKPFAFLWEMVTFKLFLIQNLNPSQTTENNTSSTIRTQNLSENLDNYITTFTHSIRQKIHIATRWKFNHTEEGKRDLKVTFDLDNIRLEFERFSVALKKQLIEAKNWKAIELDLKVELMNGIFRYYDWYSNNESYRAFFGNNSPYDVIFNIAESTEREVLKYFPELILRQEPATEMHVVEPQKNKEHKLTVKEQILIYCYEQKGVINKGEPRYNDYITFATPSKRIAYPNESQKKARWLINTITKILPYLSESAAQQAKNELHTLEANI